MKKKMLFTCLTASLLSCLLAGNAFADEPATASFPDEPATASEVENEEVAPRKMDLSVATPPPPIQRTDYVHNGFYTRVSVGGGYQYTNINDKVFDVSAGSNSFAIGGDLLVGGSPSPGMALGGGVLTNIAVGTKYDGTNGGAAFNFMVGPFFDAFPDSKGGFHMGTLLGFSGMSLSQDVSPASFAAGGGGAAWLGYDMWVAPEWSTGFELRTGGGYMAGQDVGVAVFNLSLMITVLNH